MNYKTMLKGALALSLSLMVGSALASTTTQSDTQAYEETFEAATVDTPISDAAFRSANPDLSVYGWLAPENDESKIIAGGPSPSTKALQLNTDAGTLTNLFSQSVAEALNDGIDGTAGAGAYFETEVKFVPSDTLDAGIAGGQDATKFAIYAYADENNNTTNLVVFHKYMKNGLADYTNEQFGAVNCDVYTKLRVEMKQIDDPTTFEPVNVFSVKVGDAPALTSDLAIDGIWFLTAENAENDDNMLVSSLNFKGTGEIDNIKAGVITETTTYDVTFKNGDATLYTTNYVAGDTAVYVGETPTKAADASYTYEFSGWDPALGIVNADTNYVAQFTATPIAPTGFAENDEYGSVKLTAAQAAWLNTFNNYDAIDAALKTDASGLEKAYLLNVNPLTGDGTLTVTAITVGADVRVTVALARTEGESAVTGKAINGTLKLYGTADLGTDFAELASATISDDDFSDGDTTTATFSGGTAKFFKAVIE